MRMAGAVRWLSILVAPLLLTSCLLVPAKFVSTLDIQPDRTFTFTYVGEVMLLKSSRPDMNAPDADGEEKGSEQSFGAPAGEEPRMFPIAVKSASGKPAKPGEDFGESSEDVAQIKRLAEMLRNEYGYRSVRYLGDRKLAIDYRISGTLDHAFLFPFNPDGEIIVPFVAIELRGKDRVRVKAPGFASEGASSPMSGMGGLGGAMGSADNPASALDGTFTLTTGAEIVSQNQEDGAQTLPDGSRKIIWTATPLTKGAPMAVLKVRPLP